MRQVSIIQTIRLWNELNPWGLGLTAGILIVLATVALIFPLRTELATGTVERITTGVGKQGLGFGVTVVVDGQSAIASANARPNCRPGDRIQLLKTIRLSGMSYTVTTRGCAIS